MFEVLKGKTLFVTGGTGFLGTALIESALRKLPDTRLAILIRPGRNATAAKRLERDILRNSCFDRLRAELGPDGFRDCVERRLLAVAGDVSVDGLGLDAAGEAALAGADVVVHSAATVSFDATLDQAVEINLLGPSRVLTAYQRLRPHGSLSHFISVSTAYVAGSRKGDAEEAPLSRQPHYPKVSWRDEVASARELRRLAEQRSREAERLHRFRRAAEEELGSAGVALLAERTERLRVDWVKSEMVSLGRARAQSLGWPDAYAMSKALGEQALEEHASGIPVSVVRPSIIESAVSDPYPGWIRGFRMAEPIIISFARGLLKDFPGAAEAVIDVIPVDFVVGALLAVAASPPPPEITFYHSASGSLNPLRYSKLVSLVRRYFTENPLYDERGSAIKIPEWTYPGRGEVESKLHRSKDVLEALNHLVMRLPLRGSLLDYQDRLAETKLTLERAQSYVELYGAYAECEANYLFSNLLEIAAGLDPADRELLAIDPRAIDWDRFILETHLPSVVEHARARTSPVKQRGETRDDRLRRSLLTGKRMAVFDLENTLIAANVVDSFAWLATERSRPGRKGIIAASLIAEAPKLLALDSRDRSDFLRYFYRRYRDADLADLEAQSARFMTAFLLRKAFPRGMARVRAHRASGHHTVLVTGALSFIVEPIAPLFDEVIALDMPATAGRLTGEIRGALPIGEARADLLRQLARRHGYSEEETVAYADSTSDLPLLEAAGVAVAVNPDPRLRQLARRRGWLIEEWSRSKGFSPLFLPIGRQL